MGGEFGKLVEFLKKKLRQKYALLTGGPISIDNISVWNFNAWHAGGNFSEG